MSPAEIIGSLRRRGIVLAPAGDGRLRYRPREALTASERAELARHRDAIAASFNADPIGWRAAVMATQVPQTGAISLLLARPGIAFPPGSCCSCGDPRSPDQYRCLPCATAAVNVFAASMATHVQA
jgi:hypothetical protein